MRSPEWEADRDEDQPRRQASWETSAACRLVIMRTFLQKSVTEMSDVIFVCLRASHHPWLLPNLLRTNAMDVMQEQQQRRLLPLHHGRYTPLTPPKLRKSGKIEADLRMQRGAEDGGRCSHLPHAA